MYFSDFESFKQAEEGAKSFIIEVMLVDGSKEVSSAFPLDVYSQAMSDIATVEELKTMFVIWNRGCGIAGAIKFIPYDQIRTITVLFGPSKGQ
jgi:hypothetical protein